MGPFCTPFGVILKFAGLIEAVLVTHCSHLDLTSSRNRIAYAEHSLARLVHESQAPPQTPTSGICGMYPLSTAGWLALQVRSPVLPGVPGWHSWLLPGMTAGHSWPGLPGLNSWLAVFAWLAIMARLVTVLFSAGILVWHF